MEVWFFKEVIFFTYINHFSLGIFEVKIRLHRKRNLFRPRGAY
ncbi:hypothetical protein XBKQ1_1470003 [Xenorhabdus bovienii str. kraussei Quebec]|uniref:Uncharacterized protein n=1 Tax=Xenorhabdus bovienii str. kraussei Quebec TaxID=1398203 RepID=A0A077PG62_XENBV|nr:hypothetical protein XBKQ1_1470003 [Xenorhabdus bovienii str. kraussei Quebec]